MLDGVGLSGEGWEVPLQVLWVVPIAFSTQACSSSTSGGVCLYAGCREESGQCVCGMVAMRIGV